MDWPGCEWLRDASHSFEWITRADDSSPAPSVWSAKLEAAWLELRPRRPEWMTNDVVCTLSGVVLAPLGLVLWLAVVWSLREVPVTTPKLAEVSESRVVSESPQSLEASADGSEANPELRIIENLSDSVPKTESFETVLAKSTVKNRAMWLLIQQTRAQLELNAATDDRQRDALKQQIAEFEFQRRSLMQQE